MLLGQLADYNEKNRKTFNSYRVVLLQKPDRRTVQYLDELDKDPEANGLPNLMYVGPARGFMGGVL